MKSRLMTDDAINSRPNIKIIGWYSTTCKIWVLSHHRVRS